MKRSSGYLVLKFETQTLTGLGSGPILTRWKSNVLHSVYGAITKRRSTWHSCTKFTADPADDMFYNVNQI